MLGARESFIRVGGRLAFAVHGRDEMRTRDQRRRHLCAVRQNRLRAPLDAQVDDPAVRARCHRPAARSLLLGRDSLATPPPVIAVSFCPAKAPILLFEFTTNKVVGSSFNHFYFIFHQTLHCIILNQRY